MGVLAFADRSGVAFAGEAPPSGAGERRSRSGFGALGHAVRTSVAEQHSTHHGSALNPEDVIPSRLARRRARGGLGVVLVVWIAFDAVIGLLVRTHWLDDGATGYSLCAGVVACFAMFPMFYGSSFRARLATGSGRRFVAARTLTGTRAVDLEALVSVRRFALPGRFGGTGWDELRLRDRHGVRLAVVKCEIAVDDAIFAAAEADGVRVSGHAERWSAWRYRVLPDVAGKLLALVTVVCCVGAFPLVSGFITSLISGTSF